MSAKLHADKPDFYNQISFSYVTWLCSGHKLQVLLLCTLYTPNCNVYSQEKIYKSFAYNSSVLLIYIPNFLEHQINMPKALLYPNFFQDFLSDKELSQ